MARTCSADNCSRSVWGTDKITGKGYCQRHQFFRTDKKKKTSHIMEKKKKEPIEFSFGYKDQTSLFLDMWHDAYVPGKGVVCPFTNEKLDHYRNTQYFFNCFSHILPKGRYTYWKFNPANIRIVHPTFHRVASHGTLEERKYHPGWKFDEWDALVLEKKEEYQKFKQENLLA